MLIKGGKNQEKDIWSSSLLFVMRYHSILLLLLVSSTTSSFLRTDPPAAEDAVENTGDPGCVDGLVFKDTLDVTRNPAGPHCVKGKRENAKMKTFVPQKKTMSTQVMKLMDSMVGELEIELREATENRKIQLASYMQEGVDQNQIVGVKKNDLETTKTCKRAVAELITANVRNTDEETKKIISEGQLAEWTKQEKGVTTHAEPYRAAYAKANDDFKARYNHLNSVRKLIHNMTAKINQFYVKSHSDKKTAAVVVEKAAAVGSFLEVAQQTAVATSTSLTEQPRFQEMLQTIQSLVNHPSDPIKKANLNYQIDNATTGVREDLPDETHVSATLQALDDVKQKDAEHVDARGHLVKVGSDVGGYVYLVLTRISNTVSDELSSLKASFQLQTATRKSVIAQADHNIEKLQQMIAAAKETNKAANHRLEELKKENVQLHLKSDACKVDINDATSSLDGSKHLAENLHLTLEELTAQLDRQITDIAHELKLAKWAHKLMVEKMRTMKKRVSDAEQRATIAAPTKDVAPAEVVMDEKACLEGGPKDWCSSTERMFHCGVTESSCDAYLAPDPIGDQGPWPGHEADKAAGEPSKN